MEKKKNTDANVPGTYAIIRHGGKQYRVQEGSRIKVDQIAANAGDEFTFSDVLSVVKDGNLEKLGKSSGTVKARVVAQAKDRKVIIFKKKRTHGYTKKQGHRQVRSEVVIESITY